MKPKKFILFMLYELIYLLMTGVILGGACCLQYVGKSILKHGTGSILFIFLTDTYAFNFFAYIAGLLIFIAVMLFNFKFLLSSYEARNTFRQMSDFQSALALALILLDCVILAAEFFAVDFFNIAFDSISPQFAALFTILGWPIILAVYSVKKFIELKKYWKTHTSKSDIRKATLVQRNALSRDDICAKSEIIFRKLSDTSEYQNAGTVLIYASTGSEVSTDTMIRNCLADGKKVFCPKVVDRANRIMKFVQINSPEDLIAGFHGIREPEITDSSVIYPEKEDISPDTLVIMPGVAFDRYRNRVGYNGGFYDTFLEKHRNISKIAIAFQLQITNTQIATDKHDIKPDLIITESNNFAA